MAERALATAYVNLVPAVNPKLVKSEVGKLGKTVGSAGQTAGKQFSSKFSSALKVGLVASGAAITAGLVGLTKSSISAASDASESINAIKVSYGDAADEVLKLSEGTAQRLGVAGTDFRNSAVRFSAFAETIGGDTAGITKFVGDVTQRATDFASVFNIDVSEALQVFQSGLSGEAEPLKRFGINLLQSEVQAYALREGIIGVGEQMTEDQKVQARYGLLMESTAKTAGDFANTSDGLANRQRILSSTFEDVQAKIGEALLPIMEDLLGTILDDVVPAIQDFADAFAKGETPLNDFFDAVGEAITFIKENWETIKILGGAILSVVTAITILAGVVKAYTIIQTILNAALWANPWTYIVIAIVAVVAAIVYLATQTTFFQDLWQGMVDGISMAWNWFVDLFNTTVENVRTFFQNTFTAVGTFFSNLINGWIGMVESFVNFFIRGINFIISGLNKLGFTVPDWVPMIGGNSLSLNIPTVPEISLPRLAEGGLVMPQKGGVLANIAEAGQPEVVYPLDRFEEMMETNKKGGDTIVFNNYASPTISNEVELEKAVKRARIRRG